ncbi:histidinol-phosphate transaminase [Massilia sp. PAMC28688]|uniref:histidinol-phosphate transaminase n=1 Tax=Massilia sp. PAMC28688 TaxID=2861283 RepID=UPI001C63AD8B|nr:histidinol-phosphate transaminase [Massilia sp. PAMC28688]QYF95338.1 histidinol-phosphate transaminase [Massilia sp. PAMC28688]
MSFIENLIANTIRPEIRADAPYHVSESSGLIKLDAMENPYPLPPPLREELGRRLADAVLNRYPVPTYASLKHQLCARMGVPQGYDVILGNGSDELISMIAMALSGPGAGPRPVMMAPVPAFVMFARTAMLAGMAFVGVPLRADLSLDKEAMLAAIATHKPSVVFLAYPNNPTGNLFDAGDMVEIIQALGETGIAVVDEAYSPFARASFMQRLPELKNMIVMRTVSKMGLAGIRLGYMAAAPELLEQFEKVRPPYNVNVLSQITAEFALEHIDILNEQASRIIAARTSLFEALSALPGITVYPSSANFLLIRVPDAAAACAKLVKSGVLVRNVSKMHEMLANCIRVTVSTPEENSAFLDAFKASLISH